MLEEWLGMELQEFSLYAVVFAVLFSIIMDAIRGDSDCDSECDCEIDLTSLREEVQKLKQSSKRIQNVQYRHESEIQQLKLELDSLRGRNSLETQKSLDQLNG